MPGGGHELVMFGKSKAIVAGPMNKVERHEIKVREMGGRQIM